MADKTSLIKITVDAEKGILSVNELKVSLNDLESATKAVNNSLNQQSKAVDGSAASLKRRISALKSERDSQAANNTKYLEYTLKIKKVEHELKKLIKTQSELPGSLVNAGKALNNASKNLGSVNSAAGLAGASVMETGRLISDLPYGIQGAANNLSQLGSMFGMLVSQASKMNNNLSTSRNVINLLSAQFFGPLGVIVAFQAAVAAIEAFSRSNKEAKEEVEDFNNTMFAQGKILENLRSQFRDGNLDFEQTEEIMKKLALADSRLEDVINSTTLSQEEKNKVYKEYVNLQEEIKNQETELTKAQKLLEEANYEGIISQQEYSNAIIQRDKLNAILESNSAERGMAQEKRDLKEYENQIELFEANQLIFQSESQLLDLRNKQNLLFQKEEDEKKEARRGSLEWYQQQISNLENVRDTTATTREKFFELTEEIIALKNEMDDIFGVSEDEEKPDFTSDITASAYEQGVLYKDQLEEMGLAEEDFLERRRKNAERMLRDDEVKAKKELEIKKKVLAAESKIQDTKSKNAIQGFKLLGSIAKEGSKLQALALIGENAAGIAKTIISTKAANAAVRLKYAAIPGGALLAKKQVVANNISAAIGVAAQVAATQKALAAMKATESAAAAPRIGDDDAGGEPQQPDFNIVGVSQLNQLATTIAGQEEQPVRAYVVASDVSTAQELDRNILSEASIG